MTRVDGGAAYQSSSNGTRLDKPAAIALIPKDVTLNMGSARTNGRTLVAVKGSHWADDETWATSRWSRTKNRPKALASVLVWPKTKQLFKNIGTEGFVR